MNAIGTSTGVVTEIMNYGIRTATSQTGMRAQLQVYGKTGARMLNHLEGASRKLGLLGVGVTALDAGLKGQWQNHHTADVLIGLGSTYGLALMGPAGWAIGAGYFLLDVGIKSYTGKSITENLFDPNSP